MEILVPQPGIESLPPALAGRFLVTGPPGNSQTPFIFMGYLIHKREHGMEGDLKIENVGPLLSRVERALSWGREAGRAWGCPWGRLSLQAGVPCLGLPRWLRGEESACPCRRSRRHRLEPSPGQEDPLEKAMAPHSSLLAWRTPWAEEPGGLQSVGSQESRTRLSD